MDFRSPAALRLLHPKAIPRHSQLGTVASERGTRPGPHPYVPGQASLQCLVSVSIREFLPFPVRIYLRLIGAVPQQGQEWAGITSCPRISALFRS